MSFISLAQAENAMERYWKLPNEIKEATKKHRIADEMVKIVKAHEMIASEGSAANREMNALASPAYLDAVEKAADAEGEWAGLKTTEAAVKATLECWRTLEKSARAVE